MENHALLRQNPLAVALCALRAPQSPNEPPSPLLAHVAPTSCRCAPPCPNPALPPLEFCPTASGSPPPRSSAPSGSRDNSAESSPSQVGLVSAFCACPPTFALDFLHPRPRGRKLVLNFWVPPNWPIGDFHSSPVSCPTYKRSPSEQTERPCS